VSTDWDALARRIEAAVDMQDDSVRFTELFAPGASFADPANPPTDDTLTYDGEPAIPLVLEAGDVALFVSDVWHRRLPSGEGDPGRYFLQCHYGRRDIAQRVRPTAEVNQASAEAIARAASPRDRTLIGLHPAFFYDG
jgi:hypothetical protein